MVNVADGYISYSPSTLVLTWEEVADGFQTADFVSLGSEICIWKRLLYWYRLEQKIFHFTLHIFKDIFLVRLIKNKKEKIHNENIRNFKNGTYISIAEI